MEGHSAYMTVKEIVDLSAQDKLDGYPEETDSRWPDERKASYKEFLLKGLTFGLHFILYLRSDGVYEVIDGKHLTSWNNKL